MEDNRSRVLEVAWNKVSERHYIKMPVLPMLHACHESREIALEVYEHFELENPTTAQGLPHKPSETYID